MGALDGAIATGAPARRRWLAPAVVAASIACGSCAPAPRASWPPRDPRTWPSLVAALEHERDVRPKAPWKATLRFVTRDPRSGRVLGGRGAIAVAPGAAVRMILVGGAGSTVLDAWVTRDGWRVAVPPAGIVRRGAGDDPDDLPVGFLRWWFVAPLAGTLVAASSTAGGTAWLLAAGGAVIDLRSGACPRGRLLRAVRRASGRTERVEECRAPGPAAPGDLADYVDDATGLTVHVELESAGGAPPGEEAFRDPDAPAREGAP